MSEVIIKSIQNGYIKSNHSYCDVYYGNNPGYIIALDTTVPYELKYTKNDITYNKLGESPSVYKIFTKHELEQIESSCKILNVN